MDAFFIYCIFLCILVHILLRRLSGRRQKPLPPGPSGLPLLGALPAIGPEPHRGLARLAARHGPIMYLKMGTSAVVVVSSGAAARAFLKTLDAQYANRPDVISAVDITYGRQNMVFADYGPKWKFMRKLASVHLLGPKAMAGWAHVRRAEVANLVRTISAAAAKERPVVLPELLVCALANIVGQILLSKRVFDCQGDESNSYKDMIVELLTGVGLFNIGDFTPAVAWMDLQGVQAKLRRIHRKFDDMVEKLLEEHAATAGDRVGQPDFVDLILQNRHGEDGETITDVNIRALVFDMFTAGTDTSSIVVEWAMAEMLRNPSILSRLQSEIDEVVGRNRLLEESDIANLPYLQAVCKEALRLHPSTPLSLPHFSFDECEVDGFSIPANTRLLVNIWAIGRDAAAWDQPLEFFPERFLTGPTAKVDPLGNHFELIPFGAGRRICAGKLAGMTFVHYFLGILVHAFDWKLADGEKLDMEEMFGIALPKKTPLKALVRPRLEPSAYNLQ